MLHQTQVTFEKLGTEIIYNYKYMNIHIYIYKYVRLYIYMYKYIHFIYIGFLFSFVHLRLITMYHCFTGIAQNLELASGFTFVGCCQASEGYMQLCSWKRYKDFARVMPVSVPGIPVSCKNKCEKLKKNNNL